MIRHIVALNFIDGTTPEVKQTLYNDLAALDQKINGIIDFQARENVSVEEPVIHGFRDLFWFDFRDIEVRDAYLADPDHQAIGARLVAQCEGGIDGILVMDVEP